MESRLQSNEVRIPKRFMLAPISSVVITGVNNSIVSSLNSTTSSTLSSSASSSTSIPVTTTSYIAINLTNSTNNNSNIDITASKTTTTTPSKKTSVSASTNAITSAKSNRNISINNNTVENLSLQSTSPSHKRNSNCFENINMGDILTKSADVSTPTPIYEFDLDAPSQYFKSSFARSLSLAGCPLGGAYHTSTNQTQSLDFGVNFALPKNSPIQEETTQQSLNCSSYIAPFPATTTASPGLVFSTLKDNLNYNTLTQQHRNKAKNNIILSLPNTQSSECNGDSHDSNGMPYTNVACNDNINTTFSSGKINFLNGDTNPKHSPQTATNANSTDCNSYLWSTSKSSNTSSSSGSSLRKQNFYRHSLDSSEIELLRLKKECQNLVEENRRLMDLASGMVRSNLRIPGNSSNIEAVILQTQLDTLQWQLKQVEASREMYRAVMEEVVRFLERCHRNLESLQNQQHQQVLSTSSLISSNGTTNATTSSMRPRSMHQMTYRHNDIIESDDTSSIISMAHNTTQAAAAAATSQALSTSSALNQSSLSSIFLNQNMSPRARSSTNIIDASSSTTTIHNDNGSTLDDDTRKNSILLADSTSPANATAISHNNFRDFTWRRSPKRQQISQLATSANRDVEKLSQEAFRLLRTAQNLLHTQEPDLTQSKTLYPDLSFTYCSSSNGSHSSSSNGSNGIINHHHSTLVPSASTMISSQSLAVASSTTTKSNSPTNLEADPFSVAAFARKANIRESRLSLRSSTDSSVHSTISSTSSKTAETDDDINTTLQLNPNSSRCNKKNLIISSNSEPNKESPVFSATVSSSTTEDESGFSSISSFQEIGLPLHSTMIYKSGMQLNSTSNSQNSSKSEESSANKTIGSNMCNSRDGDDRSLTLDNRNSTIKSVHHQQEHQHNLVNGIALPISSINRRWDSAPGVPHRNSIHRFTTVANNGNESPTVLWV